MYAEHVPLIRDYAWSSPEAMTDVLVFARATVRRQLSQVRTIVSLTRRCGAIGFPDTIGQHSYTEMPPTAYALFTYYHTAWDAMFLLTKTYGFGLATAGFVVQMVFGEYGCLDVHNLSRLGRKKPFRQVGKEVVKQARAIRNYVALCNQLGSTEQLWNGWCTAAYKRYPKQFESPDHMSRWHVDCIVR